MASGSVNTSRVNELEVFLPRSGQEVSLVTLENVPHRRSKVNPSTEEAHHCVLKVKLHPTEGSHLSRLRGEFISQ